MMYLAERRWEHDLAPIVIRLQGRTERNFLNALIFFTYYLYSFLQMAQGLMYSVLFLSEDCLVRTPVETRFTGLKGGLIQL